MEVKIQNILLQLPDTKLKLILELREVIKSSAKDLREILKWGRLTFVNEKELIAFICSCPDHDFIELGFFKAASLSDPGLLLKGNGKFIKRIRIDSTNRIPARQIKKWIKEAI